MTTVKQAYIIDITRRLESFPAGRFTVDVKNLEESLAQDILHHFNVNPAYIARGNWSQNDGYCVHVTKSGGTV